MPAKPPIDDRISGRRVGFVMARDLVDEALVVVEIDASRGVGRGAGRGGFRVTKRERLSGGVGVTHARWIGESGDACQCTRGARLDRPARRLGDPGASAAGVLSSLQ